MLVSTIVASNYLPHARVFSRSFAEHHPDGRVVVLVVDAPDAAERFADEPFEALGPYDLEIDRSEYHRMAMLYDVKELSTAVKPFLLRSLLRESDHAVYFDPDIEIFTPLDSVAGLARDHSIVLTPHTLTPIPRDGCLPDDRMILQAGIFNLGFIGVGTGAGAFLDWWSERLRRDCVVDVPRALFVDQRWVDFVPALFEHHVLRDPGCNVAYWNLYERHLDRTADGYTVNGAPLRFFHFSGFDPTRPDVLSAHMGDRPRLRVSDDPLVEELCRAYGDRLLEAGYGAGTPQRYHWSMLPNGAPVTDVFRTLYRSALTAAEERGIVGDPPDPFAPTGDILAWLAAPDDEVGGLPRLLAALWVERPDLQAAFPDVRGADRNRYLSWAATAGVRSTGIPREFLPPIEGRGRRMAEAEARLRRLAESHRTLDTLRPAWRGLVRARFALRRARGIASAPEEARVLELPRRPRRGVTVVGYLNAELGVGEAARRLLLGVEHAGIPHSTVAYRRTVSRQRHETRLAAPGRALYDVNVVCVNADQLPVFARDVGSDFFRRRRNVGLWFWEVSEFPVRYHDAFEYVDEVWTASEFVHEAVAAVAPLPVHVLPLPVVEPRPAELSRADLGLSDDFLFLFSFDFMSTSERKNPLGLLDAFSRSFAPGEGPRLVIKTINGDLRRPDLQRLVRAAAKRDDVEVRDGYVTAGERDALVKACDCYVSLHRSEGFGLTMAEAMILERPVIATGYSGNTTFMDERNSLLVPYELVEIPPGCDPYPAGALWAQPDVEAAGALMREVYEDRERARELGVRAGAAIRERLSAERCAEFLRRRLDELREGAPGGTRALPRVSA